MSIAAAAQATFWCVPPAFLADAAAAGIALVNSLGNIAGFVAPVTVGWMASLAHSSASAQHCSQ